MATLYEVELYGTMRLKPVIGQLTFASDIDDPSTTSAFALLQALGFQPLLPETPADDSVLQAIVLCNTTLFQMNEIFVRALYDVSDFITQPVSGAEWAGQIVSSGAIAYPNFMVGKLRTNRVRTDIRRGTFALFSGTEENCDDGTNWDAAYQTLLGNAAAALNAPPSYTVGAVTTEYRPCVISKERYVSRPGGVNLSPRYAYRYYGLEADQFQHVAIGVTWSIVQKVRHQDTRDLG